jgi:hypothetical protein
MWFDNAEKAVEYSTIHRREMGIDHEKKNATMALGSMPFQPSLNEFIMMRLHLYQTL